MSDQPRDPETGQFVTGESGADSGSERETATGAATGPEESGTLELTAAEQVDLTMRQTLAAILGENIHGSTADNDFDYYEIFEWDENPGVEQFYALALRNPYAFAVTFLPASTSWRDAPRIVDEADTDGDGDTTTAFEAAIEEVADDLDLWSYCKRADKLAGIGEFGVLVLEYDDIQQADVADSAGSFDSNAFANPVDGEAQLTGLRPFSEASIDDVTLGGPGSGRWGQPVEYDLDLTDEDDDDDATVSQAGPDTLRVHHSRVIHIPSDELLDDEVRGIPRQQPVYNNLIDIERSLGSAGQLAYRAAAWGININIDKDFDLDDGGDDLREHLHRWEVGLENVLRTHGAQDVQSLGGEEIDPSGVIDPNIEAIASQPYMPPQSVLKGNETGERATTQDLKEWYGDIGGRRTEFDTPKIVRPVIDSLIAHDPRVPEPSGRGYLVEWIPLFETSAKDEAEIQKLRAQMLKEWTGGMPDDYLTREQQRQIIEEGVFPSEMDEVDTVALDESSDAVQAQFEALQGSAAGELTAGSDE